MRACCANTPLVVDGVLYFEAGYNVVHAVDAATGLQVVLDLIDGDRDPTDLPRLVDEFG